MNGNVNTRDLVLQINDIAEQNKDKLQRNWDDRANNYKVKFDENYKKFALTHSHWTQTLEHSRKHTE